MIKVKRNKERKEMKKYKTLCAVTLVATMGIGLFGCSSNTTAPEEPKETEKQETKKKIPTEVMSAEETLQLPTETSEEKYLVIQFNRYNEKNMNHVNRGFGQTTREDWFKS